MIRRLSMIGCIAAALALTAAAAPASDTARSMYDKFKPSLVAVKYTYANELGSQELITPAIIISDDGLVIISIGIVSPNAITDDQMKDFKIIIPSDTEDETEIDATLVARDERSNFAFVRAKEPQKWTSVKFEDAPAQVGDTVYSVGLLPRGSGYKARVTEATVSAVLRGPVLQVLVDGELAAAGGLVANAKGQVIGYVHPMSPLEAMLNNPENPEGSPVFNPPARIYVPAADFLPGVTSPPTGDKHAELPWFGAAQLKGLDKEIAEYYGLKNVPTIQVGDVVKDSPADKAGLKTLDLIVGFNGKPLERGDLPMELPLILSRKIQWLNVGDTITLKVKRPSEKDQPDKDVSVTLAERPKQFHTARRFYARDLGFVVREVIFSDTYRRKLPPTTGGVVVALLQPQAAAQAARLGANDLITQMNGKPVADLDGFKTAYNQIRKDKPRDPVVLEVSRPDGRQETINIEAPQTGVVPGEGGQ